MYVGGRESEVLDYFYDEDTPCYEMGSLQVIRLLRPHTACLIVPNMDMTVALWEASWSGMIIYVILKCDEHDENPTPGSDT